MRGFHLSKSWLFLELVAKKLMVDRSGWWQITWLTQPQKVCKREVGWLEKWIFHIHYCLLMFTLLAGGNSNIFGIFTRIPGKNDPIWRAYFSDGLKPPTSLLITLWPQFSDLNPDNVAFNHAEPEDLKPWHYMLSRHIIKTGWGLTWLQNGWTGVIAKIKTIKVCHSPRSLSKTTSKRYVCWSRSTKANGTIQNKTKWNSTRHMWPSTKPLATECNHVEGHLTRPWRKSLIHCVCHPFSSTRRIFVQLRRSNLILTRCWMFCFQHLLSLFLIPFTSFDLSILSCLEDVAFMFVV